MGFTKDRRRYQWVDGGINPCVNCGADMHNIKNTTKMVDNRVKYHAKGLCKPCYTRYRQTNPNPVSLVHTEEGSVCSKCTMSLDSSQFYPSNNRRSGWCRVCHKLYKFNMTRKDYEELLQEQNYVCAICKEPQRDNERLISVDHDHSCCPGVTSCGYCVRGLLCNSCNTGLGFFKDSPNLLGSAIEYLKKEDYV